MEIKNILLPVDGSECRIKFLGMVREIALAFDAEITILHVQDKFSSLPIQDIIESSLDVKSIKNAALKNQKSGMTIINNMKKFLKGSGLRINSKIESGNPAEKIIDIAENEKFDIIIMCSHGMSLNKKFSMGSVTNKVVHYGTRPVLVIKHDFCKIINIEKKSGI